ncbi:MAG: ABC-F family ATP-binding cassette domain-containing protein [Bacteroidia bacterium]|nr:ABC-F family ATP-binding cassette domain-containing protein [Bacteroidia bacterium]
MNFLQTEKLHKSYGDRVLFRDLDLSLDQGDKMALIAPNGKGKSTLMNILAGLEHPDSGRVTFRNDIRIGFLPQDPPFDPQSSAWDCIFDSGSEVARTVRQYEQAVERSDTAGMQHLLGEMDRLHAWGFESRAKEILGRLQITELDKPVGTFSGGQKKRVALAKLLLDEPDLYLLDEPTNHLDIDMVEWLEEELNTGKKTILMVTHDRYFLDDVCNGIIELDDNNVYYYKGDYAYYLEKRAERRAAQQSEYDSNQNILRRELEWVRRQPKARGTKSKSRLDAYYNLKDETKRVREEKGIEMQVKMQHLGSKIVELIKVSKSYGDKVLLDKFTYTFNRGERIAIAGANGTGKTTLLNMLVGRIQPDAGKIIVGDTIQFGFYEQNGMKFSDDERVIEHVRKIAEVVETASGQKISASQMLTRFDFPPDRQWIVIGKLSGGEKKRLYLLTVLMQNPNFLILDEPTNDLDILTLNKLEEFLLDYPGCLVVVSHDRHFMDKICDHTFVLEGKGQVRVYPGNYTRYRAEKLHEKNTQPAETVKPATEKPAEVRPAKEKIKLSFKEKMEFEQLESDIPRLEAEKKELEQALGTTSDGNELTRISERLGKIIGELDEKSMRWLELSEFIG